MGLLDASYSAVNTKKPRKSDRILPATELNARGLLDAATNVPIAGDALSGVLAAYDASKGDYGSAAVNALGVLPFVSGTFIGKGAKTWDAVKAAEAAKRIDAGENAAKVWKETGYGKAPWDKAARSEIDDSKAIFNIGKLGNFPGVPYGQQGLVSDALSHKKLASAYPDIPSIELTVTPKDFGQRTSAAYMAGGNVIPENINMVRQSKGQMIEDARNEASSVMDMANDPEEIDFLINNFGSKEAADRWAAQSASEYNRKADLIKAGFAPDRGAKSDALHELQHAIQQREGWAKGGSPEQMASEWSKAKQDQDFYSTLDALAREANRAYGGSVDKAATALNDIGIEVTQDHIDELMRIGASAAEKRSTEAQNILKQFGGGGTRGDAGNNLYQRLAGEAEARLTQARMNLSPEQRLAQYPYDPEYFKQATGVDINNLIVRGLLE